MIKEERLDQIVARFKFLEAKLYSSPDSKELKSLGFEKEEIKKTYNLIMNINIQILENKEEWESHYNFTWYPDKRKRYFIRFPCSTSSRRSFYWTNGYRANRTTNNSYFVW